MVAAFDEAVAKTDKINIRHREVEALDKLYDMIQVQNRENVTELINTDVAIDDMKEKLDEIRDTWNKLYFSFLTRLGKELKIKRNED